MKNVDILGLTTRIEAILSTLNEYQRRRYLSAEAKAIGYGGVSLVSRLSGASRQTLTDVLKAGFFPVRPAKLLEYSWS
ncbi:hypothetical protein FACS1894122_01400 [Alphaproteobacteria bacterium]|nr:hypothetical protein FACS1894122_01400 [Alphaproteobacteria bacterium]